MSGLGKFALKNVQKGPIVSLGHGPQLSTKQRGLVENVISKTETGCKGGQLAKILYLEIGTAERVSWCYIDHMS